MTESNNLDVSKKLSQQLETKIEKVNQKYAKTKNEIKAEILDIYNSAMVEGFSAIQARRICEERIDIFSDRTIRRWLPGEATRSYSPRAIGQMSNSNKPAAVNLTANPQPNRRLVVPEEPTIPPPPEVVKEVEIVRDSQIIDVVFDPLPIDRDSSQVFIMQIDIGTSTVKKYKTVGRRTITR